jgi:ElaB/YqjD/DUF883 family membrane-anchored ribosome-binding protein
MEQTMTMGRSASPGLDNPATNLDVEGAAQSAHQTIDKVADRMSAAAHRAVDSTASAATTTAQWASGIPDQARRAQTRFTEVACENIRARPLTMVASALAVGYLLGRLARL